MSKVTLNDLTNLNNQQSSINTINGNNTTIETAFDNTLSRDGTSPNAMEATLDMNSNHIINLPEPAGQDEPLRLQDITQYIENFILSKVPQAGDEGKILRVRDDVLGYDFTETINDSTTNDTYPLTDDKGSLGRSTNKWSDLFLASGAVINFNASDVTITHSADQLTIAGLGAYTVGSTGGLQVNSDIVSTGGAIYALGGAIPVSTSVPGVYFGKESANNNRAIQIVTPASGSAYIDFSPVSVDFAGRILYDTVNNLFSWSINGSAETILTSTAFYPATSDGNALGTSTNMWSDLFLASGAVINFNNGDYTLTHSSGVLTCNKDLRVTTEGTDNTSVATLAGTQTLTNKTIDLYDNTINNLRSTENLFQNPLFKIWEFGTPQTMISAANPMFCNNWSSKFEDVGTSGTITRVSEKNGGAQWDFTVTGANDFVYCRQYIPGINQFSGRTFTMLVDVETTSATLKQDWYINARWNATDPRLNLTPTFPRSTIGTSRRIMKYTVEVPDLSSYTYTPDASNGIEATFRFVAEAAGTFSVKIYRAAFIEGECPEDIPVWPCRDADTVTAFYDTRDVITTSGMDTYVQGKRRLTLAPTGNTATIRDDQDSANVTILALRGNRTTPANSDRLIQSTFLNNSAGTSTEVTRISHRILSNTAGAETGQMFWGIANAGVNSDHLLLQPTLFAPTVNGAISLGFGTLGWLNFFLSSGAVVNFNNGDYTLTHSSGVLTANKDLRVTTVGTNTASVVTCGGTQTLTNKTLTSPVIGTIVNTGTLTLPTSTDTLVGRATTDTLTNKTTTTQTDRDGSTKLATTAYADSQVDAKTIVNTQTASYTLVIGDAGKTIEMNVGSANTLTIPVNSSVALPVGTYINLTQYGAGQVTITPDSGVTINSAGSALKTRAQYSTATLYKRTTDEWIATGDLTT